jgi:hypothetical protein
LLALFFVPQNAIDIELCLRITGKNTTLVNETNGKNSLNIFVG